MKLAFATQLAASLAWAFRRTLPPDVVVENKKVYVYYPTFINLSSRREREATLRRYHAKETK